MMVRVFANGPGDLSSILGRAIPKTQKMVLDAALLNTQHYKERIKGKVEQSRERGSAPLTSRCSSYRKGSLRVTLDYGRQLYLLYLYTILTKSAPPRILYFKSNGTNQKGNIILYHLERKWALPCNSSIFRKMPWRTQHYTLTISKIINLTNQPCC